MVLSALQLETTAHCINTKYTVSLISEGASSFLWDLMLLLFMEKMLGENQLKHKNMPSLTDTSKVVCLLWID